jgi:hypothetical protein
VRVGVQVEVGVGEDDGGGDGCTDGVGDAEVVAVGAPVGLGVGAAPCCELLQAGSSQSAIVATRTTFVARTMPTYIAASRTLRAPRGGAAVKPDTFTVGSRVPRQ